MSIQKIIQESINSNPLEMKEALAEELRNRVAEALAAKMEEVEQINELSPDTLHSYIKKATPDVAARAISAVTPNQSAQTKKHASKLGKRISGITSASGRLADKANSYRYEEVDLGEETKTMKDGYYVTNQRNSEVTHDKPFSDSKSAISHANRGENSTGYVHRVHKVKNGKIDKQWEYNGGHHEGGWEHFSDFKGDDAHQHMRNIPKHFFHGHSE